MLFHSLFQHQSYPSLALNCSFNVTDLLSLDKKGGSIPLSAYSVMCSRLKTYSGFNTLVCLQCYVFKAKNILGVQYPFGLSLNCLALFLSCICFALFLQLGAMNLYDTMNIWMNPWLGSQYIMYFMYI